LRALVVEAVSHLVSDQQVRIASKRTFEKTRRKDPHSFEFPAVCFDTPPALNYLLSH